LSLSIIFSQRFVLLFSVGNYIVALARLPMRVSEALGECKSTITRLFGEYNFQFYVLLFKVHCFLLSVLARKSLTQTYLPGVSKVSNEKWKKKRQKRAVILGRCLRNTRRRGQENFSVKINISGYLIKR